MAFSVLLTLRWGETFNAMSLPGIKICGLGSYVLEEKQRRGPAVFLLVGERNGEATVGADSLCTSSVFCDLIPFPILCL